MADFMGDLIVMMDGTLCSPSSWIQEGPRTKSENTREEPTTKKNA